MKGKLKEVFRYVVGSSDRYSVIEKFIHILYFTGLFIVLFMIPPQLMMRTNWVSSIVLFISLGVILISYYLTRFKSVYTLTLWVSYLLFTSAICTHWFLAGGSSGSTLVSYFMLNTVFVVMFDDKSRFVSLLITVIIVFIFISVEYNYPYYIQDYLTRKNKLLQLGYVYILFMILGFLLIRYFVNQSQLYSHKLSQAKVLSEKEYEALLESHKIVSEDLEVAQKFQRHLIPDFPPTAKIAFKYIPAKMMGGDYFNIFGIPESKSKENINRKLNYNTDESKIGIFIGDVSGNGVSAAFLTFTLSNQLSSMGATLNNPAKVMEKLNQNMTNILENNFITAIYCVYDKKDKKLTYCNAGHNIPLLVSSEDVRYLPNSVSSIPLGIMNKAELSKSERSYKNKTIDIGKKETLFCYTDGVVESGASLDNVDMFGKERLYRFLDKNKERDCYQIVQSLTRKLRKHYGSDEFDDDISMIAMRL